MITRKDSKNNFVVQSFIPVLPNADSNSELWGIRHQNVGDQRPLLSDWGVVMRDLFCLVTITAGVIVKAVQENTAYRSAVEKGFLS